VAVALAFAGGGELAVASLSLEMLGHLLFEDLLQDGAFAPSRTRASTSRLMSCSNSCFEVKYASFVLNPQLTRHYQNFVRLPTMK
jgi:hypothetical protein